MILTDKYNRIILWGVDISREELTAQLAYFSSNINLKETILTNPADNKDYRVKLPSEVRGNDGVSKAQNITLDLA